MISVSVIIVTYYSDSVIKQCLESIPKQDDIEVLVVDNTQDNRGFGKACNEAAKKARGKYLFFLNPDTVLKNDVIDQLRYKLKIDKKCTIAAPQLQDEDNKSYLSFTKQASYLDAWTVYSPLNQLLQNTYTVESHWYTGESLDEERSVESVSGAAFMMRSVDFLELGGFDEQFFMYWEDADLCRRVINGGGQIHYLPEAKVMHQRGGSTPALKPASKHFKASRLQFFIKHFGPAKGYPLNTFILMLENWRRTVVIIVSIGMLLWLALH